MFNSNGRIPSNMFQYTTSSSDSSGWRSPSSTPTPIATRPPLAPRALQTHARRHDPEFSEGSVAAASDQFQPESSDLHTNTPDENNSANTADDYYSPLRSQSSSRTGVQDSTAVHVTSSASARHASCRYVFLLMYTHSNILSQITNIEEPVDEAAIALYKVYTSLFARIAYV